MAAYIEHVRRIDGLEICDLREQPLDTAGAAATAAAMKAGIAIIVQAPLLEPGWAGRADVLRRVESASDLGGWSYEPLDTKLARETRGSAILQLCAYASALERIQGRLPESVHVVAPGKPFDTRTYRLAEYAAYYRLLRQASPRGPPVRTMRRRRRILSRSRTASSAGGARTATRIAAATIT